MCLSEIVWAQPTPHTPPKPPTCPEVNTEFLCLRRTGHCRSGVAWTILSLHAQALRWPWCMSWPVRQHMVHVSSRFAHARMKYIALCMCMHVCVHGLLHTRMCVCVYVCSAAFPWMYGLFSLNALASIAWTTSCAFGCFIFVHFADLSLFKDGGHGHSMSLSSCVSTRRSPLVILKNTKHSYSHCFVTYLSVSRIMHASSPCMLSGLW